MVGALKKLPAINDWSSSSKRVNNGKVVKERFFYASEINTHWMSVDELNA